MEAEDHIVLEGKPVSVEELEDKPELGSDENPVANYFRDGRQAREGVREREEIAYFVHLRGLAMESTGRQIEETGGQILSVDAASSSFLVLLNGEQSKKVEALMEVDLVRPLRALDKLGAELEAHQGTTVQAAEPNSEEEDVEVDGEAAPASMLDLLIVLLPGQPDEEVERIEKEVSAVGGAVKSHTKVADSWRIKVTLPATKLEVIASFNAVLRIDRAAVAVAFNDLAGRMIGLPDLAVPLTGAGQIIGHADTGIDRGTEDSTLHGDLAGQILRSFAIGRKLTGDWSDPSGHGTHTAATLVGTGIASGGLYRGIAPGAKLIHQSLMDSQGEFQIPPNPDDLYGEAYRDGARIHSDSWGTHPDGMHGNSSYDDAAQSIDSWAWNQGHPMKMLIVCAAGNDGPGERTLAGTATAKNCLTVGATGNGTRGNSAFDVYERSSRGPTEGNRMKPDLIAPGAWIASARTQAAGTIWKYDLETESDWQAPPGFHVDTTDAHSAQRSWHYQQDPGDVVSKVLRSRPFVVPAGFPVYLEFAAKGTLPPGSGLRAMYRKETDQEWRRFKPQPVSESRWTTLAFQVPQKLQGIKSVLAIEIFSVNPIEEPLEVHIDDLRLSTFYDGGDLSDLNLAHSGDSIDQLYTLKTGTSMATPVVAGAAALLRQFLEENGVAEPSAELLKAMLINGANRSGSPSFDRGWGVLDLRRTLPSSNRGLLYQEGTVLSENTPYFASFDVRDSSEPLRITLVWCDAPGARLTNNLNLVVHGPGDTLYYPFGASQEHPDTLNNVEGIDISNPAPGPWRVEVAGLPLGKGPQPYVVVVSGAVQAPGGGPLATISAKSP
jgi:subtilisin family serine protease